MWISSTQTHDKLHLIHSLMFIYNPISSNSILENEKENSTLSPAEYFKLHPVSTPGTESALSTQFRAYGSDPTHCGSLWPSDQVSKKKGQQSGDLLKIVENSSSHDWHLIFLLTLAPNQRWCQDCIRHQPTNLSVLLREVWSILSPSEFRF